MALLAAIKVQFFAQGHNERLRCNVFWASLDHHTIQRPLVNVVLLLVLLAGLWRKTSVWSEAWSSGGGSTPGSRGTSVWCSNTTQWLACLEDLWGGWDLFCRTQTVVLTSLCCSYWYYWVLKAWKIEDWNFFSFSFFVFSPVRYKQNCHQMTWKLTRNQRLWPAAAVERHPLAKRHSSVVKMTTLGSCSCWTFIFKETDTFDSICVGIWFVFCCFENRKKNLCVSPVVLFFLSLFY